MTISSDDVRHLLDADDEAVLVLIEGRVEVIAEAADDADRDGLEVISRADLVDRFGGDDPSDYEIDEQAATLDAAVAELGG